MIAHNRKVGVALDRAMASAIFAVSLATASGCSHDRPPPPARTAETADRAPREVADDTTRLENTTAYRRKIGKNAELYLPPWFAARDGGYDLMVHFHGLGKLQEGNIGRAQLNVAVVSVNFGVGSEAYGAGFRDPRSLPKLLDEVQSEIEKSGRAPNAKLRRLALSAWSAGEIAVAKVLDVPANAERVDAVLLADGFFTSFSDPRKRLLHVTPLEKFARFANAATKNDKLFAITHTSIPTGDYPSTTECVGKLLEMTADTKVVSSLVGPRNMREIYSVDHGSFHVKGYDGLRAGDHIRQIQAMGETLYPYLKNRWEPSIANTATAPRAAEQMTPK